MPRNIRGGKNAKRGKNHAPVPVVKELNLRTEDQEYGRVTKILGNCRVRAKCFTENGKQVERLCIIPGKFRKRVYINLGDLILVNIRSFQDDKVDVVYKYPPNEIKRLIKKGIVPDDSDELETNHTDDMGIGIEFMRKEEEVPKPRKEKLGGNYLPDDMLPPVSDEESETPEPSTTEQWPTSDTEEITLDDL